MSQPPSNIPSGSLVCLCRPRTNVAAAGGDGGGGGGASE
jgi:hypothetical protein